MHLIKSGNKYYLSKIGTKNYLWDDDYIIENGQLKWCHPNIYLKGDGNSWLQFNYHIINRTTFDITYQYDADADHNYYFFGAGSTYQKSSLLLYKYYDNNTWVYYRPPFKDGSPDTTCGMSTSFNYKDEYSKTRLYSYLTDKYNITMIKNSGVSYTRSANIPEDLAVPQTTTQIFRATGQSTAMLYPGKIYYLKVFDNPDLVFHFIPVPTGLQIGSFIVPSNGMFDIVNQQFYPNQGSGIFTYGKDT